MIIAQSVTAGWNSYCQYGYETTYGTAPASYPKVFGHGTKITVSRKNNGEAIYGLGSRNATASVAKKYEGSVSVEYFLSNATFLRAVLGAVDGGSGGGPYTHTYTEANVLPSFGIADGAELGTNDQVSAYLGCKVDTCTITAAVNEMVKVRLECPYKTETLATSGIGSQVAQPESPFMFAEGNVELPNGTVIGNVQSVELTISNSLEMIYGLGSRFATAGVAKNRKYALKMTVAFSQNTDLLTKFLGDTAAPSSGTPAETATVDLVFTNGLSTTSERTIHITLANVFLDAETLPKDVNEIIKEDVEGWARSASSVTWTNNTALDNSSP